ncbi:MAG: hypothetical protein LBU92_01840 [Prevotellaceae bacterium]|jgi:hypothetical protein|nr:hypothetical protein [Prevotellaceae bacterium]
MSAAEASANDKEGKKQLAESSANDKEGKNRLAEGAARAKEGKKQLAESSARGKHDKMSLAGSPARAKEGNYTRGYALTFAHVIARREERATKQRFHAVIPRLTRYLPAEDCGSSPQ